MDNEVQNKQNTKVVVKVEITTLLNSDGKFNNRKYPPIWERLPETQALR